MLNLRGRAGDLARYEFIAAPRPFVIEQNSIHAEHAVRFAIVSRQFKSGYLADAIWTAWIKRGRLALRHFAHAAKHLGRSGEIKTALRAQLFKCRFYFAGSSEMFGRVREVPQRETTPF